MPWSDTLTPRLRRTRFVLIAILALVTLPALVPSAGAEPRYAFAQKAPEHGTLGERIAPPEGFRRVAAEPGSWAEWLRGLPMKREGAPVMTFSGWPKWRQDVHVAVIDIDVGNRDLQQCADAVMRLRAEWLYASGRASEIAFKDTDGKTMRFSARKDQAYPSFRKFMDYVFAYAGTYSLDHELKAASIDSMAIGDVFIKGGFPGHAVLVADMVENPSTGEKRFLLVQSYMPAQDMHVLKNPASKDGSPWYETGFGDKLVTPEWTFDRTALKRWPS